MEHPHELCDKSKSLSLINCTIQTNKRSGKFEVVASDRIKVQACVEAATIKEKLKLAPMQWYLSLQR